MKKRFRWKVPVILGIFLFWTVLQTRTVQAAAGYADLSEMQNGHEVTSGYEVDGDYIFVPKVTEHTEIVFDGEWDNLFCRNSEADVKYISRYYPYADTDTWYDTRSAVLTKDKKGRLSVELRNVGEYNGSTVNLKVTLMDWANFTNLPYPDYANAFITMGGVTRLPQINVICVQNIVVRFAYYNEKGEPLSLKGHYTLNDLDFSQGFQILNQGGDIYYTKEAAARMGYDAKTGIIWADRTATEPERPEGWITYTFEGAQTDMRFYVNAVNPKAEEYPYRKWDVSRWPGLPASQKKNLETYYKGAGRTDVTEENHTAWITSEFGYTAEAVIHFGKKGNVIVKKTDQQTGETLEGAEFVCYEWNKNTWKEKDRLQWDAGERDYRIFGLLYSETNEGRFKIKEVKNPAGYKGNWEQEVVLNEPGAVTFKYQAQNEREKGKIRITKKDGNDGTLIDGAVFRITAKEDIRTVQGTVLTKAGTLVETLTVRNGNAVTGELEFGTYLIQEEKPAPGYIKSGKILEAALTASNKEVSVEFQNMKNQLVIQKVSKGDGKVLPGVEFCIWNKNASENEGTKCRTDTDGKILLQGFAPGTYRIRETEAPKGYLINPKIQEFTVTQDGKMNGEEKLSILVENAFIQLRIIKSDASTGEAVTGAELALYDQSGEKKESWISGREAHLIQKLQPGVYTLKEEKAPDSYEKAEPVTFTLKETEEIQTVEMKDLRKTDLEIVKRIRADEITWAHGNPVFCFTVQGKDLFQRSHRRQCTVEFTEKYVREHTDGEGMVEKSVILEEIPMGNAYDITEQETLRYGLVMVTGTENVNIQSLATPVYGMRPKELFKVTANLEEKPAGSRVIFENKKYRWDDYSHTDIVENVIPLK